MPPSSPLAEQNLQSLLKELRIYRQRFVKLVACAIVVEVCRTRPLELVYRDRCVPHELGNEVSTLNNTLPCAELLLITIPSVFDSLPHISPGLLSRPSPRLVQYSEL